MHRFVVILIVAFTGALLPAAQADGTPFHEAFGSAREAYKEKDWAGAQVAFLQASRLAETDDEKAVALIYVGHSHRRANEHERAIHAFAEVLRLKTVGAGAVYQAQSGIATCAFRMGNEARARQALEAILHDSGMDDAQRCYAHLQLAGSWAREEKPEKAKQAIMAALALPAVPLRQRVEAIFRLGNLFYMQSNYAHAREAYASILVLEQVPPAQLALAQHRIGLTHFSEKNFDTAIEALQQAIDMHGNGHCVPESVLYLGLAYVKKEAFARARAELEKVPNLQHAAGWHVRTAQSQLEKLDEMEKAPAAPEE